MRALSWFEKQPAPWLYSILSVTSVFVMGGSPPVPTEHLLTLALGKGYIERPKPCDEQSILSDFDAFSRRLRIKAWLMDNQSDFQDRPREKFNPKLYLKRSSWNPPRGPEPLEGYIATTRRKVAESIKSVRTPMSPMTRSVKTAITKLKGFLRVNQLTVCAADKNLGMVVVPVEVVNKLTSDALSEFEEISQQRATSIERYTHSQIKQAASLLDETPRLQKFILNSATPENSEVPTAYVLLKVHKLKRVTPTSVPPARLIVPATKSVSRSVSRHIDHIVRPVWNKKATYSLPDSSTLVRIIETTQFPPCATMATRDVAALYPNVDINGAICAFSKFIKGEVPPKMHKYVMKLIRVIMKNAICQFNGKFYLQVRGTAMGNSTAVLFANIWLFELEHKLRCEGLESGKILCYTRLIDDIWAVFNSEKACDDFWTQHNLLHPNLKVTGETGDKLAHLDLTISKSSRFKAEGRLDIDIHQKHFNKCAYLPWSSFHTFSSKKAWINAELQRGVRNCSDKAKFLKYAKKFADRLTARNYPITVIKNAFAKVQYEQRETLIFGKSKRNEKSSLNQFDKPTIMVTRYNPTAKNISIQATLREDWPKVNQYMGFGWQTEPIVGFKKSISLLSSLRKETLPKSPLGDNEPSPVT